MMVVACAVLISGGCDTGQSLRNLFSSQAHERPAPPDAAEGRPTGSDIAPRPASDRTPVAVVALQFDILRVDFPIGGADHAAKVWNHADEMRLDVRQAPLLVRNGMRMGAIGEGAWPALQAIFDAARATMLTQQQVVRGGEPVTVELGQVTESQTVFSYDRGGRLAGRTIPDGAMLLKINYAMYPQITGRTELEVSLEVRHDLGKMAWENRGGQIVQVPAFDVYAFDELTTRIGLSVGESLVIGPSDQAGNDFLPGSRFFSSVRGGNRVQTVWIVKPRPYEMRVGSGQPR
jgi:hypothetical protein